jgi:hypothetical protein
MPTFRAQVTLPLDSAVPADAITNTWYFQGANTGDSLGPEIKSQLQAFYTSLGMTSLFPIELGPTATLKCYDLDDAEPRNVVHQDTIALTASGSAGLPHECAVVLSFVATVPSGESAARRRGRIFLGPLSRDTVQIVSGIPTVEFDTRTAIVAAASDLQDAGDNVCQWVIYSPTHHQGRGVTPKGSPATPPHSLADSVYNVTAGWVDNAFDTMRSRGVKATSRLTWT